MYKCLQCGKKIPLKVVYLYSFFGFHLDYKCTNCQNIIFKKVHYIVHMFYGMFLASIYSGFGILLGYKWGIGILFVSIILLSPIYFKILLWAEKRSRKKEK